MQINFSAKQKAGLIYLVIVLVFLFLCWTVWLFFNTRMDEKNGKKKNVFIHRLFMPEQNSTRTSSGIVIMDLPFTHKTFLS